MLQQYEIQQAFDIVPPSSDPSSSHGGPDRSGQPHVVAAGADLPDPAALTYEPHFGLREKPFGLSPDPRFFFSQSSHGEAFDTLLTGIRRREGIMALTGEVGTGKTTVCRAVLEALDRKTFAAFVPDPFLSRKDLLKTLLVDFGVCSVDDIRSGRLRGASRTDLSYPLYDFLRALQPLQAFAVVMIDEAQHLPSQLLEEIRVLSDLEQHHQKLLQVLLVGQPELQARLDTIDLRPLTQRLSVQCELRPLARNEVSPYIAHRLRIAGSHGPVQFTDAALDQVYAASGGIPRVINLVCDRALFRAARANTSVVDVQHVLGTGNDFKLPADSSSQEAAQERRPERDLESLELGMPEAPQVQPEPEAPLRMDEMMRSLFTADPILNPPNSPTLTQATAQFSFPTRHTPLGRQAGRNTVISFLGSTKVVIALLVVTAAAVAGAGYQYWMSVLSRPRPVGVTQLAQSVAVPAESPVFSTALRELLIGQADAPTFPPVAWAETAPDVQDARPVGSQPSGPDQTYGGRFALQMATFQSAARATQSLQEVRDAGYSAYSVEVSLRDGERSYAVFLGPYFGLARAQAQRDLEHAQQLSGYDGGRLVQVPQAASRPTSQP